MPYHWWLIAALILAIGEMYTLGFLLGCLTVGALAAGLTAIFTPDLNWQMAAFTVVALISGFTLRPLAVRFFHKPGALKETNAAALINQVAIVVEPPDLTTGVGRVLVGGENWRARVAQGADPELLQDKGTRASVVGIEGATVLIEPVSGDGPPPMADSQLSY
jgi:membrane protein implicated in regulation of membrane protease activity